MLHGGAGAACSTKQMGASRLAHITCGKIGSHFKAVVTQGVMDCPAFQQTSVFGTRSTAAHMRQRRSCKFLSATRSEMRPMAEAAKLEQAMLRRGFAQVERGQHRQRARIMPAARRLGRFAADALVSRSGGNACASWQLENDCAAESFAARVSVLTKGAHYGDSFAMGKIVDRIKRGLRRLGRQDSDLGTDNADHAKRDSQRLRELQPRLCTELDGVQQPLLVPAAQAGAALDGKRSGMKQAPARKRKAILAKGRRDGLEGHGVTIWSAPDALPARDALGLRGIADAAPALTGAILQPHEPVRDRVAPRSPMDAFQGAVAFKTPSGAKASEQFEIHGVAPIAPAPVFGEPSGERPTRLF